jgi:hypothetical protein
LRAHNQSKVLRTVDNLGDRVDKRRL